MADRGGDVMALPSGLSIFDLTGRVALVTGGAGGIGSATAERLLSEGACVLLADVDAAALKATSDALAKPSSGNGGKKSA